MKDKDKRRHPRITERLPVEIGCKYAVIKTETKNISCSGAYCHVDRAIPVMSKVRVSMAIPTIKEDKIVSKNVSCEGVVLRYDGNNTAIMFTKISKKDKDTLAGYVKARLALVAL